AHPENLTSVFDGFYSSDSSCEPIVPGNLGEAGPFEEYVSNNGYPEYHYVDINIEVFDGDSPTSFFNQLYEALMPGSLDFITAIMVCPAPGDNDSSPTIGD